MRDSPVFIDGTTGRTITFGEFNETMKRAAKNLENDGMKQDDVIAIHLPNCVSPSSLTWTGPELANILLI